MSQNGTEVPARIALFGFDSTHTDARVVYRPHSWRVSHGLFWLLGCWALVPVVVFVPPHFPWALAAFFTGPVMAYRRFTEHYTLLGMRGECPRCGAAIKVEKPTRLSQPHSLHCDKCHNDLQLVIELDQVTPAEQRAVA